jgi:hypothetical protein
MIALVNYPPIRRNVSGSGNRPMILAPDPALESAIRRQ